MKPCIPFMVAACFAPAMVSAQPPAPVPLTASVPLPPQSPEPPVRRAAPAPLPAPEPVAVPLPHEFVDFDFDFAFDMLDPFAFDSDTPHPFAFEFAHLADEAARHMDQARVEAAVAEAVAAAQGARMAARVGWGGYEAGLDALQHGNYEEAIALFDRVVSSGSERADAARYWKAFALYRAGQPDDARATLALLRSQHPGSRYLADAQVLEAELKQESGQPVDPAAIENDEIKLLAIQGLRNSDQAVPLLRQVMTSANSLDVKRRALYVLALNEAPGAEAVLTEYARGAGNPDLQVEAIRYVASRRGPAGMSPLLREVYADTHDIAVKREVIKAYAGAARRRAPGPQAEPISEGPAVTDLLAIYGQETNPVLKRMIAGALASRRDAESLVTLARSEKDPEMRTMLVRHISGLADQSPAAAAFLADVLR